MPPTAPIQIIGSYISPYVRKVLVCLHEKGIAYEIDPIVPFFGDERFSRVSPVRRIPVLIDDAVTLCDSSVICQYLEDRHPAPQLYPADVTARAQARWLEEYADTAMTEGMGPIVFERIVKPGFLGQPTDATKLEQLLAVASERWFGKPATVTGQPIPAVLDWLESQLPTDRDSVLARFSIADVALGAHLSWLGLAGFELDEGSWPRTARYRRALEARPSFKATAV